MKTTALYPVLLTVFVIGSVVSQNAEELPIPVESDNLFPPEHSESDGHHNGDEITTVKSTQITSEADVAASSITNENKLVIDTKNETSFVDFTVLLPSSPAEDIEAKTLINKDESVNYNKTSEIVTADAIQTSSVIADGAVPTLTTKDKQNDNEGKEPIAAELSEPSSGLTINVPQAVTFDENVTNIREGVATTVTESNEKIYGSILALTPAETKDNTPVTYNGGRDTTASEPSESTSGITLSAPPLADTEQVSTNNERLESSAVDLFEQTSTPEKLEVITPALANDNAHVANNGDRDATAAESNAPTLGSTLSDAPAPTLASDDEEVIANNIGSETTAVENIEHLSESTKTDLLVPALTNNDSGFTNDGYSETAAFVPNEQTFGSTLADEPATILINEEQISSVDGSKSTAAVPIKLTSGSTIVHESTNSDYDEVVTNVGSEYVTAEPNKPTSASTISNEDMSLVTDIELTNEGSETTVTESYEPTTGFFITDKAELTLESEDNHSIETSAAEALQLHAGLTTVIDVALTTLTATDSQDTNTDGGQDTTTEGGQDTTTEGGGDTTTEGGQDTTTEGGGDTTTEVSQSTVVERSEFASTITIKNSPVTSDEDKTTTELTEETTPEPRNEGEDASKILKVDGQTVSSNLDRLSCPELCVCITEGDSNNYIVDCSGRDLTNLPSQIDPRASTLKLQNNKLKVIPKEISNLKNLKFLNANDNLITELEIGSVSELPELLSLSLANNRFIEYPPELVKPSFLNKLEELDLAGNEFTATLESLSNFKALRSVTLPEVSSQLVAELCSSLKEVLVSVCSKSCEDNSFECSDTFVPTKDDSLDATLPGTIPFIPQAVEVDSKNLEDINTNSETSDKSSGSGKSSGPKNNQSIDEFSLRNAVKNAPQEIVTLQNIVQTSKDGNETDVKVGAKTTETKAGGGVDKSVIAVIVAGMVIIIAVITIKKNWSSISKRFSSTPRPNDRSGRNTNGTTPEEVPLQDKSPV